DVLRGGALARILKEREQRQQQQNNDDPEGGIAQIRVHRFSFVVARIAASCPSDVSPGNHEEIPRSTTMQFKCRSPCCQGNHAGLFNLTHYSAIPVQIMALKPALLRVVKAA